MENPLGSVSRCSLDTGEAQNSHPSLELEILKANPLSKIMEKTKQPPERFTPGATNSSINPKSCKSNPLEAKDSPKSHPSGIFQASPFPFLTFGAKIQTPNPRGLHSQLSRGVWSCIPTPGFFQESVRKGLDFIPTIQPCFRVVLEDFPAFPAGFCPVDSPTQPSPVQLSGQGRMWSFQRFPRISSLGRKSGPGEGLG